ncbi:MAG: DEAD/DEAH box helicase [Myxococcales bacterium]|nr:DEAD/DEAH box helicase [Myxococcales bacterium]
MADAFGRLHRNVQRKLHDMRWTSLNAIQVEAIEHLLGHEPSDCVIAAPTAGGKTEAAFLPVLSAIADDPGGGVRAMYVGPLKALINDQFRRVEDLCERMEMPVHRWHGDVAHAQRKALLSSPAGVLLITPESLEAMFILRPTHMPRLFARLAYVVIDEMHAFLGSVRGAQLISQLHRLRVRAGTDPLRIGLSATLGDPQAARRWLRPDGRAVRNITQSTGGARSPSRCGVPEADAATPTARTTTKRTSSNWRTPCWSRARQDQPRLRKYQVVDRARGRGAGDTSAGARAAG